MRETGADPMSEKVESVEALAEIELLEQGKADAAAGRLTSHDDVKAELEAADALQLARTEDWTVACAMDVASYFIDGVPSPHTRQEVTVIIARHADDELLRMREKQPATPPEPVVTDGDRELAKKILYLLRDYGTITDAAVCHWLGDYSAVFAIIAKARQAERDELQKAQLTGVSQMNEIRSLKEQLANSKDETERARYEWGNWESMFGNQQKQLVASHEKIKTLEEHNRTLMAALYGIETCASAAVASSQHPATADAEGGSDG